MPILYSHLGGRVVVHNGDVVVAVVVGFEVVVEDVDVVVDVVEVVDEAVVEVEVVDEAVVELEDEPTNDVQGCRDSRSVAT